MMVSPLKLKIKPFRRSGLKCVWWWGRMYHGMRGGQRIVSAVCPESVITDSLLDVHSFHQTSWTLDGNSLWLCLPPITGAPRRQTCYHTRFKWVPEVPTRALMLAQRGLYPLSHLPSFQEVHLKYTKIILCCGLNHWATFPTVGM